VANRILVVDDHDVVRHGVLLILRAHSEWEIVGEAGDGFEAIAKTQALDPDLVILDISMPRKDGLEVLTELVQMKTRARIIVLTMHESKELAEDFAQVLERCAFETRARTSRTANSCMAVAVIERALFRIGQNRVGLGHFLELLFCIRIVGIPIGMVLHGQLPISALQFLIACRAGH